MSLSLLPCSQSRINTDASLRGTRFGSVAGFCTVHPGSVCGTFEIIELCHKRQHSVEKSPRRPARAGTARTTLSTAPLFHQNPSTCLDCTVLYCESCPAAKEGTLQTGQSSCTSTESIGPDGESHVQSVMCQIVVPGRKICLVVFSIGFLKWVSFIHGSTHCSRQGRNFVKAHPLRKVAKM